ncbi:unnamed protein product [[Candida] boidinii]|nr:unnamed protein product [[Candida] boidinii]
MDDDGYILIKFISKFSRVSSISNGDNDLVIEAIKNLNDLLEINEDNDKVRLIIDYKLWVLPKDQRDS